VSAAAANLRRGPVFPHLEASFRLEEDLRGANPFDFTRADVQVSLAQPDGATVRLPAFFDGNAIWRVRYTPRAPGRYKVAGVTLNGRKARVSALTPGQWNVAVASGRPGGFVRRDPADYSRLAFDGDGSTYYPIGHNVAWQSGSGPDVPAQFARMKTVGENWSRVWMNHWDRKNLDWVPEQKIPPGDLSLDVARKWDAIVNAAEANGIRFQMTFQHHGQYSSSVNPNWGENPWNKANGGFLEKPDDFFTSEQARALTRAKYRYIIARYGYSPNVLAWELFNEVQFTDAARNKQHAAVAAWHREMAAFLRAQDPEKHLVTSSSDLDMPEDIFGAMDYLQPHAYPPDAVAAAQTARPSRYKKPIFYGEIGGQGDLNADTGEVLHAVLWGSLMSEASGAAQYWTWDAVVGNNLYGRFASATAFVRASGLADANPKMRTVEAGAETPGRGSVSFGPGAGWATAPGTVFTVSPQGTVAGAAEMPAYLQGRSNTAMFPRADFPLTLDTPATFTVRFRQSARAGAHPALLVDGQVVAEKEFPAGERDTALRGDTGVLTASLSAGRHTVRLENRGADWAVIDRITLTPYGPTLRLLAKAGPENAVLWARNTGAEGQPTIGKVILPAGLTAGRYRIVWWDTAAGRPISESLVTVKAGAPVAFTTPPIARDAAAFVRRVPPAVRK
jgi:hypothetical protein